MRPVDETEGYLGTSDGAVWVESPTADWTILDEEGVEALLHSAAVNVSYLFRDQPQFAIVWDVEDFEQEARIILAIKSEQYRGHLARGKGLFRTALRNDLKDLTRGDRLKAGRETSLERLQDEGREADDTGTISSWEQIRIEYHGEGVPDDV